VERLALKADASEPVEICPHIAPEVSPPRVIAAPEIGAATFTKLARRWLALNRGTLRAVVLGTLALLAFLLAWHLLTKYRVNVYVRFLNVPSPEQVLERAARAFKDPKFFSHVVLSCRRILIGFLLATIVAVPLGLVMGRFRVIREFIFPVSEVFRPIPAIAWVPMSIMLWPNNEAAIVYITFIGAFFPILLNTIHGVHSLDGVLVRAGRCLGANEPQLFWNVILPGSLPHIFTGLAVGMGVAWVSLIAAEMISGQYGVGYFTWEAYSLVDYPAIMLGMITIGVLGLACSGIIRMVGVVLMPWLAFASGSKR
jgi:NitT/TauT family transport system permease protein